MTIATTATPRAGPLAWALLILLGLIWGSSFMLTNIAVREAPPMTLAALRLILAAALIAATARLAGARFLRLRGDGRLWGFALASALIGNVLPFWLISWSQQYIPSALSGLLMAPMPLISLMLAHFLIAGERMNAPRVIGFVAGFAGIVVLIGPDALGLIGGGVGLYLLGQFASLAAMLCYAINGIALKRAAAPDALGISAAILMLSALISAPLALALEADQIRPISVEGWAAIVALGVGATAMGQILLMKIIALAGPPFLASVNYQVPLWATVFGVALLGETLPGAFWIALGLILAGLAVAQFGGRLPGRRGRG